MKTWEKIKQEPALWKRYLIREKIMQAVREFFQIQAFREVEVPLLTSRLPIESYVEIFETRFLDRQRKEKRAFLTTSPELFLKKLLVAGIGNCFSLTKSFRNMETFSNTHNPEFTILEWYQVDVSYKEVAKMIEQLLLFIYSKIAAQTTQPILNYQGQKIDLTLPWKRISMTEAFTQWANMDLVKALDEKEMHQVAAKKGYQTHAATWEELFHQIYLNEVVPQFPKDKPLVIYDYPLQLAALAAKPKTTDPRFVERFEVYVGGIELADGCSEMTNWYQQQKRFEQEKKLRNKLGKIAYPEDSEFIKALQMGLPPCAGIALGIDRLVMLFTNVNRIQDVLFFPAEELWGYE